MDITPGDIAQTIIDTLTEQGARIGAKNLGPGGRDAFVTVRLPTGQTYEIRVQEVW